jgi:SAM-dependent methyltransferase
LGIKSITNVWRLTFFAASHEKCCSNEYYTRENLNERSKMNFLTYLSKQARKPIGLFDRYIVSRILEKGNSELNTLVFEVLSKSENEHVLEIGFGTGKLIKEIADHMDNGVIEGVDFSETMVAMAKKKNLMHIKNDKVNIHLNDFDNIHFDENCFDKIVTVNTIYFWENPKETISKIYRLLKPGGKLFIGLYEKSEMEKMPLNRDVFKYYSMQDLKKLLLIHGSFEDIDIVSKNGKGKTCYCVVGTKFESIVISSSGLRTSPVLEGVTI